EKVYDTLVKTVNDNLHLLHRYTEIRKKFLELDSLKMYDMYVPLVDYVDFNMTYNNAKEWLVKALQPLGEEYISIIQEGLDNRWVDVYQKTSKLTGDYTSGKYGTNPYILMNGKDNVNSLFTLAHEFSYSVLSYYSKKKLPANLRGYSISVADVASTFNEALLA